MATLKKNGVALTATDKSDVIAGLGLSSVVTIDPETGVARLNPDAQVNVYASTAAGLAAVADGVQFQVVSADARFVTLYRRAGAAATKLTTLPTGDFVLGSLNDSQVGRAPTITGTSVGGASYYFWPGALQPYPQRLTTIEVAYASVIATRLAVAKVEVDGSLTLVSHSVLGVPSGISTHVVDIEVPAGCVVGLGGGGALYYDAGPATMWSTTVVPANSTPKTISSSVSTSCRFSLKAAPLAASLKGQEASARVGVITSRGFAPPTVSTGTAAPAAYSVFDPRPVPEDSSVLGVTIGAGAASTMNVLTAYISATGVVSGLTAYPVQVPAGVNTVIVDIPVLAGMCVGLSGSYRYQPATNPAGTPGWFKGTLPINTDTLLLSSLHRYEFWLDVRGGIAASVTRAERKSGATSFGALSAADATGVADATAVFAAGRAGDPTPYVRPGSFTVTALPSMGSGLWGPGQVTVAGSRFFLPPAPSTLSLYQRLRAALYESAQTGDVLTLVGDSISHFAYAPTGSAHWFNMLTRFVNYGVAVDEPLMTALRPSSTYLPTFYGVTTAGTVTTGTRGPIGESLILAEGASLTVSGAYSEVGVFYTQEPAAGSLDFSYNGAAAYKTVVATGLLALDSYSGSAATPSAVSGAYTITAVGGRVEITGLVRLGPLAPGAVPRLRTSRASHGSYSFASFGAAAVTSMAAQATYAGGKIVPIIALGINDSFGTPVASIVSNATALLNNLQAAGAETIYALPPVRPTAAWAASYTGGRTFDPAAVAIRKLYRQRGVVVIPVDSIDWEAEGFLQDGLHPNGAGNARMAQIAVEHLGAVS